MAEKQNPTPAPEPPRKPAHDAAEVNLGGEGIRGETAGCPTGLPLDAEQVSQVQRPGGGGAPGTGAEKQDDQHRAAKEAHPTSNPPGRPEGVVSDPD